MSALLLYLYFAALFFVFLNRVTNQNEYLTIGRATLIIRDNVQLVQHFFVDGEFDDRGYRKILSLVSDKPLYKLITYDIISHNPQFYTNKQRNYDTFA